MHRLRVLHGVLAVAAVSVLARAAPVFTDITMNHKNIIMTLHGMLDHVDSKKLSEVDRDENMKYFMEYADAVKKEGLQLDLSLLTSHPAEGQTGPSGQTGGPNLRDIDFLYKHMDINKDDRLFLHEMALWLLSTVDAHYKLGEQSATDEFHAMTKRIGRDEITPMDFSGPNAAHNILNAFVDADEDRNRKLNLAEFITFKHPERSLHVKRRFAMRFLNETDLDLDGTVNATEFLNQNLRVKEPGDKQYSAQAFDFRSEVEEWKREFQEDIDMNGDGTIDGRELLILLDPRHKSHAISEAYDLFFKCDGNGDHELAPEEVRACHMTFRRSKLLNFAHDIHHDMEEMYSRMSQRLRHLASHNRDEL